MKTYITLFLIALAAQFTFAQKSDHAVHGTVLAAIDNSPLPGVNILIAGTNMGVVTDGGGKFAMPIGLKAGDKLVFSYLSYETQTYEVKGDSNEEVTILLKEDAILIADEIASNEVYTPKGRRGVFKFLRRGM